MFEGNVPDITAAPYVLVAYMLAWAITTAYLVYLAFKVSKVQKEIKHLSETVKKH